MDKNNTLIRLSASENARFGKEPFADQSLPQKVFSTIWAVETEVNNGGFSQYFINGSSEGASFVVEALERIGARRAAEICRRAIAIAFPIGLPSSGTAISTAARGFPDSVLCSLRALDKEFWSYPDDLTGLLFDYVSKHPGDFGKLPTPNIHENVDDAL